MFINESNLDINVELNTVMMNFGNSTIENCHFDGINILCYEYHTCKNIYYKNVFIDDNEAEKEFKICSTEEIREFLNSKKNKNSSLIIIGNITLGVVIGIPVIFVTMKIKKSGFKIHNKLDYNSNDEFQNENIRNTINNNKSNDTNVEINNNNDNKNNNNNKSLDMKKSLPSNSLNNVTMNVKNKDEMNIYNASLAEIDESSLLSFDNSKVIIKDDMNIFNTLAFEENELQPDYTETNKLISKQ